MSKRLVICCDGTWNRADQPEPTNVVRIKDALAPKGTDGLEQRVHYNPGVGTRRWEMLRGGAFGFGLSEDVRSVYRFLVEAFDPGDELFFFGFSRGAYTARSAVGLVRNCGILRREHSGRVDEAYELYRSKRTADKPRGEEAERFRSSYAHATPVHFVGAWDTVGALGIPVPRGALLAPLARRLNRRWAFHDTELSSHVKAAFQALAIDEKRGPFEPTIWTPRDGAPGQRREQVWFSGVHSDVGGGLARHALADVSLAWMADCARDCGLAFAQDAFRDAAPDPCGPLHASRTGLWRLLRPYVRQLGVKDPACEFAASSALERTEKLSGYRPANLARYLEDPENAGRIRPVRLSG
ncbi:DUF2235 domain-containing protein [Streptomyces meridianus]|uniref:DUF2235 domain-containing protein n=1 Tax=Streptomyces meridianus TaxID=2938945 RepID=A0ABT0X509_9ACTN|nr:DUF2235 domain-containing protein [Streptomyces meridianus]MCM2577618.1 DUF2235 domain-containing protein [Streptomyces meridianus]